MFLLTLNAAAATAHLATIMCAFLLHGKHRYSAIVGLPFGGSNMGGSVPPLEVATPAVLPQPPQRSDMGHHEAGNLAVFLNSRGEVTAYSATGRKLWQVRVPRSLGHVA